MKYLPSSTPPPREEMAAEARPTIIVSTENLQLPPPALEFILTVADIAASIAFSFCFSSFCASFDSFSTTFSLRAC